MTKINFILTFICSFALFTSCSFTSHYRYQIYNIASDLPKNDIGAYTYVNNDIEITYNFWCEKGDPGFLVQNNSDQIIYLNLNKSFFIKNGYAYNYFKNRMFSTTSSSAASSSGTQTNGYWTNGIIKTPGTYSESYSSHSSSGTTIAEQPIIAIPPHSAKAITEYSIHNSAYFDCDFDMAPTSKDLAIRSFSFDNSPIKFQNYICYYTENNATEQFISNSFFVEEISNIHPNNAFDSGQKGCTGYETESNTFKDYSPSRFYLIYDPTLTPLNKKSDKPFLY